MDEGARKEQGRVALNIRDYIVKTASSLLIFKGFDKARLRKRKTTIKRADGTITQGYRYFKEGGEAPELGHRKSKTLQDHESRGTTHGQKVRAVLRSGHSVTRQVGDLMHLGYYDAPHLREMTGASKKQVRDAVSRALRKEKAKLEQASGENEAKIKQIDETLKRSDSPAPEKKEKPAEAKQEAKKEKKAPPREKPAEAEKKPKKKKRRPPGEGKKVQDIKKFYKYGLPPVNIVSFLRTSKDLVKEALGEIGVEVDWEKKEKAVVKLPTGKIPPLKTKPPKPFTSGVASFKDLISRLPKWSSVESRWQRVFEASSIAPGNKGRKDVLPFEVIEGKLRGDGGDWGGTYDDGYFLDLREKWSKLGLDKERKFSLEASLDTLKTETKPSAGFGGNMDERQGDENLKFLVNNNRVAATKLARGMALQGEYKEWKKALTEMVGHTFSARSKDSAFKFGMGFEGETEGSWKDTAYMDGSNDLETVGRYAKAWGKNDRATSCILEFENKNGIIAAPGGIAREHLIIGGDYKYEVTAVDEITPEQRYDIGGEELPKKGEEGEDRNNFIRIKIKQIEA